ncbi:hypothetical protein SDRG_12766 [Saprolegnia diclina VS20]|uniref:Uncharacterized protein n=1 Tax=Saprolegnia diclina (strain VS20) TaxID=1156394 RepID=T0RI89_SAPDV|nr:hypothetical protein SDRG_12766 [Saprolegnia diclina VS20]EQC29517.1 hypothetical protein SDRG_12766 [Saprolegnia diclina VS20]|eukprot:XP_008617069.1 hypothetical protein SDRG_12766 [Saprolegnia diclina VS20]
MVTFRVMRGGMAEEGLQEAVMLFASARTTASEIRSSSVPHQAWLMSLHDFMFVRFAEDMHGEERSYSEATRQILRLFGGMRDLGGRLVYPDAQLAP